MSETVTETKRPYNRKKDETATDEHDPRVNVSFTPEQIAQYFSAQNKPKKVKAVKINDKDHIGSPFQPLVGTGEELEEFEQWLVDMVMAERPSTNPMRMIGMEGYPKSLEVIRYVRSTKSTQMAMDIDNHQLAGCCMSSPGQPNHLLMWFPKGMIKMGHTIPTDMKWTAIGKTIVIDYDKIQMKYQP